MRDVLWLPPEMALQLQYAINVTRLETNIRPGSATARVFRFRLEVCRKTRTHLFHIPSGRRFGRGRYRLDARRGRRFGRTRQQLFNDQKDSQDADDGADDPAASVTELVSVWYAQVGLR